MSDPVKIRIVLIDRNGQTHKEICAVLEKELNIEIVAETDSDIDAIDVIGELKPDVVVMDLCSSFKASMEMIQQIAVVSLGTRVLVISLYSNSQSAVRMLHAGALGYVLKDCVFEELAGALRMVVSNHTYVSPGIAGITRDM